MRKRRELGDDEMTPSTAPQGAPTGFPGLAPIVAPPAAEDAPTGLTAALPPIERRRVESDVLVAVNGARVRLRAGKVLDSRYYDLAAIESQPGVRLTALE